MPRIARLWIVWCLAVLLAVAAMPVAADEASKARAVIFLDPGHGGADPGAVYHGNGWVVKEAEVNLRVALLTADRLRDRGFAVFLSRETDDQAGAGEDANGDGKATLRDGLQSVVDQANEVKADLFLSIHHNGSTNTVASGSEAYYCADRPFADASFRFSELVLDNVLAKLKRAGYASYNRGVKDDSVLYTRGERRGHLFVLGPVRPTRAGFAMPVRGFGGKQRATDMPGALSEALFVSNATEAWLLAQPRIHVALADAFADAIDEYFAP